VLPGGVIEGNMGSRGVSSLLSRFESLAAPTSAVMEIEKNFRRPSPGKPFVRSTSGTDPVPPTTVVSARAPWTKQGSTPKVVSAVGTQSTLNHDKTE